MSIQHCFSSASLSWNMFKNRYAAECKKYKLGNFKDNTLRQFVRDSIKGGWVVAYWSIYEKDETNDYLEDFDANGLYSSVMSDETITFPDINSTTILTNVSFEEVIKHKHYIIECDIDMPKVCFIPLAIKKPDQKGCFYQTGKAYNQIYNDVDIQEGLKVGMKILRVHWAMIFNKSIPNILAPFINVLQDKRTIVKESNEILGNLYKLLCNSIYGKTVCKDIEDNIIFTTEKQFKEHYSNDKLLSVVQMDNKQLMVKFKTDSDKQDLLSATKHQKQSQQSFPTIIGSYILAHSWRVMNDFIHAIDGFKQHKVFYTDTDSLFIYRSDLNVLKQKGYFGKNPFQGKNDTNKPEYLNCQ